MTTTERIKVSIIKYGNSYHLRSKDGDVHSTRYRTKDEASIAAKKMALGLTRFIPLSTQIKKMDTTNHA